MRYLIQTAAEAAREIEERGRLYYGWNGDAEGRDCGTG